MDKTTNKIVRDAVYDVYNYSEYVPMYYFCVFRQKRKNETEWESILVTAEIEHCRRAAGVEGYRIVFSWDFCEGQTEIKDLHIYMDYEVKEILLKERENYGKDDN